MKLESRTKIDQGKTTTSKKIDDDIISAKCYVILIFRFMIDFDQSGSKITDAWYVRLKLSVLL